MRVREAESRILLIGFGFFIALALTEALLRAGLIPNIHHQRSTRLAAETQNNSGKFRILVLGDSFIDNVRCPDCVYPLLKQDLAGQAVSLTNGAGSGMGPVGYLGQMRRLGPKVRPDLVLLFYYVGNDLTNVQYRLNASLRETLRRLMKPLLEELYLYHFCREKMNLLSRNTLNYRSLRDEGIPADLLELARQGEMNHGYLVMSAAHKNYILDNVLMETEENLRAWQSVKGILAEVHRQSQKIGSRLAMVIIPHTVQVTRSHFAFFESLKFNLDERTLSSEKPQALLGEFCKEQGIACLDLLPHFRAQAGQELYWAKDEHFSGQGNRFAERLILEFVHDRLQAR